MRVGFGRGLGKEPKSWQRAASGAAANEKKLSEAKLAPVLGSSTKVEI